MKGLSRILASVVLILAMGLGARAQGRIGIVGGADFGGTSAWHAGLTWRQNLGLGFVVQPSLMYHHNKPDAVGELSSSSDPAHGCINVPVSFSWGPDLLLFRPFMEVTPFGGIDLAGRFSSGVGLGGGLEINRFQLSARYDWALCGTLAGTKLSLAILF